MTAQLRPANLVLSVPSQVVKEYGRGDADERGAWGCSGLDRQAGEGGCERIWFSSPLYLPSSAQSLAEAAPGNSWLNEQPHARLIEWTSDQMNKAAVLQALCWLAYNTSFRAQSGRMRWEQMRR